MTYSHTHISELEHSWQNNPFYDGHERLHVIDDPSVGLQALIAIHRSGPKNRALGGCRFYPYENIDFALTDVLRLSRGMTYKAAISNLPLGGAKSVILGNPATLKTPQLLRSFARHVESLHGQYITSVDVGISADDVKIMAEVTPFAVGIEDPSPTTAFGVYRGILASLKHRLGHDSAHGVRIAIQGLGKVGYGVAEYLAKDGAELFVHDLDTTMVRRAITELHATAVKPDEIIRLDVDVFSPNAMGAVLNDTTIPQIRAKIVAGGANNQLAEKHHGDLLAQRGILYAPDYVINAGGLIDVCRWVEKTDFATARADTARIYDTLLAVYAKADSEYCSTSQAADRLAMERYRPATINARSVA